ncbi:MAG: glycosyltransferase family 2 protein [Parcubacteria group bacterium]|jgi:glycosyltransferase EpsE
MKISFIIPCYNCEKTLDDTVNSIIDLKLPEFEICMVDDGSKDGTYNLLKAYAQKYPQNVRIGKNSENRGGGFTRNECAKLATADWFFLIDSDNYLDKKSFYQLLSAVTEKDNLITFQNICFFYDFLGLDLIYKHWLFLKDKMVFGDLRKTSFHPVVDGNYLFRRAVFEKVGGYETEFGALESWSFGYKAFLAGYEFSIVKGTKYFHRVDGKSYWTREVKNNSNNMKNLLLKFPAQFSPAEIETIKKAEDTQTAILTLPNDFVAEQVNWFFRVMLKMYYLVH